MFYSRPLRVFIETYETLLEQHAVAIQKLMEEVALPPSLLTTLVQSSIELDKNFNHLLAHVEEIGFQVRDEHPASAVAVEA